MQNAPGKFTRGILHKPLIMNGLHSTLIFFLVPKTLQWLPDFTECHFCSVVLSIVLTFKEL